LINISKYDIEETTKMLHQTLNDHFEEALQMLSNYSAIPLSINEKVEQVSKITGVSAKSLARAYKKTLIQRILEDNR